MFCSLSIDITPQYQIELSGYENRVGKLSNEITNQLEANIVILDNIIFISVDTLYITSYVKQQLITKLKLNEENIFISATHTHFAPALDKTKIRLGKVDDKYVEFLIKKIDEAITLSFNNTADINDCNIEYGTSLAHHSMNRRYKENNKVILKPNLNGYKDETIHTIIIKENDSVKSIIVNYACHPVSSLNKLAISSDFIGDIRKHLRKLYKNNTLPILFFQGFSGDVRPCSIYDNAKRFIDFQKKDLKLWKNSLIKYVEYALNNVVYKLNTISINSSIDKLDCSSIIKSNSYANDVVFHKIEIANILIIGISSEIVSEYSDYIKKKYKNQFCIPVSCVNGSFGYIPTDKMIKDGGYESSDFFNAFGIDAKFLTKIEKIIQVYL